MSTVPPPIRNHAKPERTPPCATIRAYADAAARPDDLETRKRLGIAQYRAGDVDVALATADQNMLVGGLVGAIGLGSGFVFRPHLDLKLQTRSEPDGSDAGSGWLLAAGGYVPARLFGRTDFFPPGPRARGLDPRPTRRVRPAARHGA